MSIKHVLNHAEKTFESGKEIYPIIPTAGWIQMDSSLPYFLVADNKERAYSVLDELKPSLKHNMTRLYNTKEEQERFKGSYGDLLTKLKTYDEIKKNYAKIKSAIVNFSYTPLTSNVIKEISKTGTDSIEWADFVGELNEDAKTRGKGLMAIGATPFSIKSYLREYNDDIKTVFINSLNNSGINSNKGKNISKAIKSDELIYALWLKSLK